MSRSAERRKRQEHRAQRRSPGSDSEELQEKLDRLGKRTRAQVENSSRRGFADLAQLPQQLFAEVEGTFGTLDSQPQVREAVGKMTEVMAAAAAMAPLNVEEKEGRKTWIPEDLKDRAEVATRDQQDKQLHQDRMAEIQRAGAGNREQRRWLARREQAERNGKRVERREGEGGGELSGTLAELGIVGFEQGGAAAVAAIHGSLEDMLKAAREAMAPKKEDKDKRPAGDTEGRVESQNDADNEAEQEREERNDEAEQEGNDVDMGGETGGEAGGAGGEMSAAVEGQGREPKDEEKLRTLVRLPLGEGGAMELGAGRFSIQGGPGSMQLGPDGVSGSLRLPFGSIQAGPGGTTAAFELGGGNANLQIGPGGVQLGMQTPAGTISLGDKGFSIDTPAGSIAANGNEVSGQLAGGGAFKAQVEPYEQQKQLKAEKTEKEEKTGFKTQVEPQLGNGEQPQAQQPKKDGIGESLREVGQSLAGVVGAAVETLGGGNDRGGDQQHKPLPPVDGAMNIAIDPALAPEKAAKPQVGAARDKHGDKKADDKHGDQKKLDDPTAKHGDKKAAHGSHGQADHGSHAAHGGQGGGGGGGQHGQHADGGKGGKAQSGKKAEGAFSTQVEPQALTGAAHPTAPLQPTAARQAVQRLDEGQRTVKPDGSVSKADTGAAPANDRNTMSLSTPQRPAPQQQRMDLPVVPLSPVTRGKGAVTQPDLQITGRGDTPATPSMDGLKEAAPPAPSIPTPATSTGASEVPKRQQEAAPAPQALPRPETRQAPPPAAAATAGATKIAVKKPGELGLPAGTTPDHKDSGKQAPGAGQRAQVPITSTPVEAQKKTAVPEVAAAKDQTAKPEVAAGTPQAPELKQPPAPPASGIPNPSEMVQPTVSLSGDRDHAAKQLEAESRTQRKVPVAADSQRRVEVAPLGPERARQVPTIEVPARTQLKATSVKQTATIDNAGTQGAAGVSRDGTQHHQQLQQSTAQQRAEIAQRPDPAVLGATAGANTTAAPVAQSRAAVQSAVAATTAARPPTNLAVSPAIGQAAAGASFGALDKSAIAGLDTPRPMPEMDPAAAQTASAEMQAEHAQNRAMIAQIRDVKPPELNFQPRPIADDEVEVSEEPGQQGKKQPGDGSPESGQSGPQTGQGGQSGQPKPRSRAAAIADIEAGLLQNTRAQLPGQMSTAAGQLASEYEGHADQAFQQNQQNLTTADQQAQQQRAALLAQPPPVNAASVNAEADQLWAASQQQAQAASADMQQQVAASQETARAGVTAATATQAASVAAAQAAQTADNAAAQAAFQSDHQAAQAGFQQQDQQAQTAMQTDQQTAQTTAQTRQAAAEADSAAKQSQAEAQHQADNAAAEAGHQADVAAAEADSAAEQQRIQSEGDQQVQQKETDLQKQTADLNAKGQQQVDQITRDGEQQYQQRIAEGQREADAKKAEGERAAAAKKAEADSQKGGGGILGAALDWVKARVGELLEAAKAILEAARQAVISILEAARKAAMAILDAARKAAMDALNAVKEAIQGAIQAVASAIRGIISAVASMVRAAIQALATALQTLVRALTTLLTTLVQVFQKMVNAILDAMIAVVSLINEDLGKQLQQATQKYRDAFNNACNTLQTKIQQAGQALEQGIQQAADRAIAVVNQAEQTLNAAVTAVEETLHNAVEAAYQKGVEAINTVYEAAKTAVNQVFDAAVAATNLYFDTLEKGLDVVKTVVDKAIDAAKQAVKDLGTLVSKVAGAIVDMLPSSALKFISDVWNSGWRNAVIIGLATIVAVAVTVGTGGVGGPIAAVLLAGLIGGTLAGGATLAGDALARQATIEMADRGEGIYVPGVGMLKVGPDGQPDLSGVPPDQREQAMKNMQWALSNFDQNSLKAGEDGRVTGAGKSHEDIGQMSMDEGTIAFAEGFVSAGLAAVGGLGGTAIANRVVGKVVVDSTIKQMVKHAAISAIVEAPVNVLSSGSTQAVRSGLETIRDGGSWEDAKKAATDAFTAGVMDPATWGSSILAVPGAAAGARVTRSAMSPLLKQASETVIEGGVELVGGGSAAATADYFKALASGASHEEALEKAKKTFTDNFSLENVLVTGGLTVGGKFIEGGVERVRGGGEGGGHDLPTIPREGAPTSNDGGSNNGVTTKPGGDRPVVVDNGNGTVTTTIPTPGGTTTTTRPVSTRPVDTNNGGGTTTRPVDTNNAGSNNNPGNGVTTRPTNTNPTTNGAPRPNYGNNPTPDGGGGTTTRRPGDTTNPDVDTKPVERPKGDGADAQRPDLDADLDTGAPDVAVGAVKGADVYPVNTRPGKNPGDPPIPVYLNSEKSKRGFKPLESSSRTFGPNGSTVSDVTHSTTTNASGHTVPQASMNLNVPGQNGGPPSRVQVEVQFRPPGELSSSPAHGDDVGPARFTLTQDSSGNWRATVEVDARSRPEDLQFIVGHELTEIGSLVHDNPGGVPSGGFGDQMNAGVMHDGVNDGTPTAHDRAAAQEVADLANELDRLQRTNGTKQENIDHRANTLEAAIKAAGLDGPGNVDAKLRLLRDAGAPKSLIDRVQLGEAQRVLDSTLGGNSNLTPEAVQHLLFPADPSGGFGNGMNGGHVTSRLLDMAGPNEPYAFHEVASADVNGTTVRQFAQFKWKGSGDKPMPGSGKAPGEPGFNPSDWTQATTPKTTADDAATYIREVDSAVDAWVAANGNTIPNDRKFTITTPSGMKIEGFFEADLGPNGRPVVRTAYIDASWLSSQAASQSASSSGATTSNTGAGTTTSTGNTSTNTNTGNTSTNTNTGSTNTNTGPTNTNSNPTAGSTSSLPNMGAIDGNTMPTGTTRGNDHTQQPDFNTSPDVDPFLNAINGDPQNLPGRRDIDGDGGDLDGGMPVRPRDPNGPDNNNGGGAVRRPDDANSSDVTRDTSRDPSRDPARDNGRPEPRVPDGPLQNFDATVEQLAHGMVGRDLTDADIAFLEQNGYSAGPIVRGKRDFVMRVFIPTREGVPPIVSFRGTVPSKVQTLIADADPSGIGMYQYNANKDLIAHWMNIAGEHGPIMVAGHSLGGALSQITASNFPDMVQSVRTFQAPGVTRETADKIRKYNEENPDRAIDSIHHRVEGDLVPLGGETLTPGTVMRYTMQGGGMLQNNVLMRHLASPLSQRERDVNGHKLPTQSDNPDIEFTYDGSISTDQDTKPGGPTETARRLLGAGLFNTAAAARFLIRLPGGAVRLTTAGARRAREIISGMFGRGNQLPPGADNGNDGPDNNGPDSDGGTRALPPGPRPDNGPDGNSGATVRRPDEASGNREASSEHLSDTMPARDPAHENGRPEPTVPAAPLQNFDATVEQLAHGMVGRDLTDADIAFLEQNGYSAGPIVRGKRDFVMRVFTPTREGVPPIVSFRGTVPSKVNTLIADADPAGIGMYQYNANKDLIAHWMNIAGQHGPIMVAGHSLGGALSQITASNFPDMVQSVRTFQAPGVTRETADKIRQYNEANPDRAIDSVHHRVEGDLVPLGGETLTPGTVMRYTMQGGGFLKNNVLMRHLASPLSQRERDVNGHKLPSQDGNPDIEFTYDGSISTDEDTKPGGPTETARRLLGAGLFNTAAAARFLIKLPGGAVRLTVAGAQRAREIINGMFHRNSGDGTRQLPPGDDPDLGMDGSSPAPRDPNGPDSDRDGATPDRDRDRDGDNDRDGNDREQPGNAVRDPDSTANPTMLPQYTRPRNERAREPSPVRVGDRSYDVMGITPDGKLQLRPEGVITRNIPVENLYGRTVELGGEAFTVASITPGGEGGGVNVRLTSVADPRLHIDVTPSQVSQINLRFPGGHNMTLGDMSHGVVRLNPPGDLQTTTAPLADGQTFEARLRGRELDGVYSVQSHDGGLIATGRDREGNLRTFPVNPTDIAPRYVDVQSANFSTPHQRSSFDAAEDRIKRTADQRGDTGMPISDPLLGTLRDQPNSQVLDGVDSLEVQGNFIRDRATPPGSNPTGAGRSMTVFNIVFNGSGEAKRVLEAMVEFRRQNPDAQIQMVVANTQSRPATEQTMADERRMREVMEQNGIELVLYAGGLSPTQRVGEDRMVIHAKGVMVDNDVMFTTAGVIDPAVKNKVDVTTELPPQAAAAFRRYFDEAVLGNATVEQRQQMAADLAAQGILVNDPVAQLPYIARANDALIGGAQKDLYINTSELKDPAITQKLIDRARAGLEVNILAREYDARSLAMLEAAAADLPNLKFGKPDTWDPRPHYNVIIADGVQAYVGTAYLWPNQQSNLQHARSFENGVLLQGEQVSSLRQQLDAHQARAEGRDGATRDQARDQGSSVGVDHTQQPSFDPSRDSSLGDVDPFLSAIGGQRTPTMPAGDRANTPARDREPTVPTAPLANFDATVEQLAHGMVGKDLTDADLAFLAQNGYKAGPIVRGKRDFVMRVFIPTKPGVPPIVSFRGTVPSKVQTLIADADPAGIGMYQFTANKDLISHWMNIAGQHGKIMVAGHSLGGALSQITAANFPDMVQSVRTFQAPGVTRETANKLRDYNQANPDQAIDSVHHRVEGDLVPLGGETLSPGTVMRYTMQGGGFLKNNVLMRHLASPLSQRERDVNGHKLPSQDGNPDIEFTYDGSISTDEDTKPGGPTETARRLLGAGLFNSAAAARFLVKLPGGAVRLTVDGAKRARQIIGSMFHRKGGGESENFVDAMNGPALDTTRQAQVPNAPLQNFDATVEQLAHGMVGRELTDTDLAFLEQNGYKAGPIVRGQRDFVMRVFIPTQEGVPPIVSFRGTVPSKVQTLIADADPSGIGMYQFTANKDLIAHWMGVAHQHGKIMVAGHSLGGALSQIAAAHFPDLVQSVRTFQAPGVTRETAERLRQYNQDNPDEAIDSVHHRVEGDLVPLGGETLTPGTLHRYTMQGGGFGKNNALSRHLSSPLSQRERDLNGNRLPVQDDNPEIGFTYDGSIDTDNDTKPGGPTEIARKVVGSAVFGTGGVIRRLRQMVGRFVTFVSHGKMKAPDPDGDGIPNQELAGVSDADAAEAASALQRLDRAEHAARDLTASADETLLAAGRRINPSDPRAAVRDAIAVEVFRYGNLLNNNAAIVAAASARLERMRQEREVRRASLHTMSDHESDHGGGQRDPFIDSMSGRLEGQEPGGPQEQPRA